MRKITVYLQLRLLQLPFIFLLQSLSLLFVDDYLDFSSRLKTEWYAELSTVVFAREDLIDCFERPSIR